MPEDKVLILNIEQLTTEGVFRRNIGRAFRTCLIKRTDEFVHEQRKGGVRQPRLGAWGYDGNNRNKSEQKTQKALLSSLFISKIP